MNCKPGDLAIVVRSRAGNEGKIVQCIRFLGRCPGYLGDDYWLIDREMPSVFGPTDPTYRDSWLKPLRDPGDDAIDETLLRLPAPEQEEIA